MTFKFFKRLSLALSIFNFSFAIASKKNDWSFDRNEQTAAVQWIKKINKEGITSNIEKEWLASLSSSSLTELNPHATFSPYSAHGQVTSTFEKTVLHKQTLKPVSFCMSVLEFGTAIGPRHILITADMVYLHGFHRPIGQNEDQWFEMKKWAHSVTFMPFLKDGHALSQQSFSGYALVCPQQWIKKTKATHNYGLIILDQPLNDWVGLKSSQGNDIIRQPVTVSGITFTGDFRKTYHLWRRSHSIDSATPDYLCYTVDEKEQDVGDILSLFQEQEEYLLALRASPDQPEGALRKAIRFSPSVLNFIVDGIKNDAVFTDNYRKYKNEETPDPQTLFNLAECYWMGQGKKNWSKAFPLYYKILRKKGNKDINIWRKSQGKLGDYYSFIEKDNEIALLFHHKSQSSYSYYRIGQIYHQKGKIKKAIEWLTKAGEQGCVKAQMMLGAMYMDDESVEKNEGRGLEWLTKAAEQGHVKAQYLVGAMYVSNGFIEQDVHRGTEWLKKAANQGHAGAQFILGIMYNNEEGFEFDLSKAVEWLARAAEQGHIEAQYKLGTMYHSGRGVEKHEKKALKWLTKAAEQEHKKSQKILFAMYYNGRGVEKNEEEALKWLIKAAEQGHKKSQKILGMMYYHGQTVEKNHSKSGRMV